MNYLHTKTPQITHRDLKSPNILVQFKQICNLYVQIDGDFLIKICDFGYSTIESIPNNVHELTDNINFYQNNENSDEISLSAFQVVRLFSTNS